jgi:hypothetical protein
MKNCSEIEKRIDEKRTTDGKLRNQFIISIKPKEGGNKYCIYLSIDGALGLIHIDQFIRDIWVECCGHLSGFRIRGKFYQDNSLNNKIEDILNSDDKFEYEYDFGSTTDLILEVIDIRLVPISFSQIEIIARNHDIKHECEICGAEAKYYSYDKEEWECEKCIDEDDDMISEFNYCNSPRDGVCAYEGNKESENTYLPGNDKKYKLSKKKIKEQDGYENISAYDENFFEDLSDVEYAFDDLLTKSKSIVNNVFNKGIYSFDITELISNLSKESIYDIAKYLGMTKISSLNKSKLIEKFLDEYEELIEERMSLFDEERYKFLRNYSDNNGVKISKQIDEETLYKVGYFLQNGMLFSAVKDGEPVILMPEVIQKLVKEKNNIQYRNMIKLNGEIVSLYRGMNKAYGLLKLKDIKEIFKRYHIEESEKYRIEDVIIKAEDYYREYEIQGIFFINCYIDNWVELLKEVEKQVRVDYTIISKDELLSMADEDYIYESNFGKTFFNEFSSVFNMDKDILEGLIESLYLEIQENELKDVITEILEQLEDDNKEIKDFMHNCVGKFLKDIRLWKFKGAKLNEKKGNGITNEKQKPIRRNDPCYCGSGKKYKDCCAKNGNVINLF